MVERLLNRSGHRQVGAEVGLVLAGAGFVVQLADHGLQLLPTKARLWCWRTLYRAHLAVSALPQEAIQMLRIEVHSLAPDLLNRSCPRSSRQRRASWCPYDVLVPVSHFSSELLEELKTRTSLARRSVEAL